jgi:hypothetical protein
MTAAGAPRHVYRSRSQSFGIVMAAVVFDVLIGAGIARNTDRTGLVALGAAMIAVFTTFAIRAATTGVVTSPEGIEIRNIFSQRHLSWDEIERFEIDTAGALFPTVLRIKTKDGRIKRAFGVQENNVALRKPIEQRPAAKIAEALNEELANVERP